VINNKSMFINIFFIIIARSCLYFCRLIVSYKNNTALPEMKQKTDNLAKRMKLIDRMIASYKERKRQLKIQKLMKNKQHWRGLE